MGASLMNSVSWWVGSQGCERSCVSGQRILQIGLEDLKPRGRLRTPLDDAKSRCAVEEARLDESSRAWRMRGVGGFVGENDVRTGDTTVLVVDLDRFRQR